jgi:hypothetical protein
MTTTSTHRAVAWTAALAAATVCSALVLASPAAAGVIEQHLAVDCPQPFSQKCIYKKGVDVTTTGPVYAKFTADGNPPSCAPGDAAIYFNNFQVNRATLQPGESLDASQMRRAETVAVEVQVSGVLGGCNTGSMSGWSGTLYVATDADALPYLPAPAGGPLCQRIGC